MKEAMIKLSKGFVEPSQRWVRVKLGSVTLAESETPILLVQFGPDVLPTYFFTQDEIAPDVLKSPQDRDGKRFWAVQQNGDRITDGAWAYINPPEHLAALRDRITFNLWTSLEWYEEEERLFAHARDPHKRVDTLASSRHVKVIIADEVIAETRQPVLLFETYLPTRYYIPQEDVNMQYLLGSSHQSMCPYKGHAEYWSVKAGGQLFENLAWSYPNPVPAAQQIQNKVCFFNEKADIYVNEELQARPVTPWS